MKPVFAVIVLSLAMLSNVASAAWVAPNLTPSNFGPVEIQISDNASNGCWTNLGEAKTYAKDKLINKGFQVAESSGGVFEIAVNSIRLDNGKCFGSVAIEMKLWMNQNKMTGGLMVGTTGGIFYGYQNANTSVLDNIKMFIDEMPN